MEIYGILNEVLVRLFRDIMNIEEKAIITQEYKDLTNNDMHVIEAIGMGEPKNMTSIARELSVTVGTLTIAMNSLVKKGYVDRYNYRQIFRFIFDEGSYSFCEDMLNEELELLRETIKANKNFIPYYQKLYAEIKNKPSMVRGHDAFEFLKQYLRQVHGIIIEDNLHELVPVIGEFSIALDIKLIENVL